MDKEQLLQEGWMPGYVPLIEGKCPPICTMVPDQKTGKWEVYSKYPEPDPDWKDPEIYEADEYQVEDKDEFYDYVTRCKSCWAEFMAYGKDGKRVNNFCPQCGKKLQ